MRTHYWSIVGFVAALTVALACGTASAARLQLPNGERGFRFGRINSTNFRTELGTVNCELAMSGAFVSRTITKTAGTKIGDVNTPGLWSCTGGTGVLLIIGTTPWELRYSSFGGTLPNITSVTVQVVGFRILIQPTFGISCLYRSTAEAPLVFTLPVTAERVFDRAVAIPTARIPLNAPTMGCPGSMEVIGEGSFTVAGEFASVQVRLIT
jgi:hypothetical protein